MFEADKPEEIVAAWDRGDVVWTIEMGGLGPGYEQCIQALFVELLRRAGPPPYEDRIALQTWGDAVAHQLSAEYHFSGAQVGAAKNLASAVFKRGMRACLAEVEKDRRIMVSKGWPGAKAEAARDAEKPPEAT